MTWMIVSWSALHISFLVGSGISRKDLARNRVSIDCQRLNRLGAAAVSTLQIARPDTATTNTRNSTDLEGRYTLYAYSVHLPASSLEPLRVVVALVVYCKGQKHHPCSCSNRGQILTPPHRLRVRLEPKSRPAILEHLLLYPRLSQRLNDSTPQLQHGY